MLSSCCQLQWDRLSKRYHKNLCRIHLTYFFKSVSRDTFFPNSTQTASLKKILDVRSLKIMSSVH